MKRSTIAAGCAAGGLAAVLAGAFGTAANPAAAESSPATEPSGDTVVRVTGDAANGFSVYHHDGTELHPPTDSEALAECGEYDTVRQRVACRTEVRTWYRDLAVLQQALEWANR